MQERGDEQGTPGALWLALVFLAAFVIAYFGNLKFLAGTWWVR